MRKGFPELYTLFITIFIPKVLIDILPSKFWAYMIFIPIILSVYISLKVIEKMENLREKMENVRGNNETIN